MPVELQIGWHNAGLALPFLDAGCQAWPAIIEDHVMPDQTTVSVVLLDRRVRVAVLESPDFRKIPWPTNAAASARILIAFSGTYIESENETGIPGLVPNDGVSPWLAKHYAYDPRARLPVPYIGYIPSIRGVWVTADSGLFVEVGPSPLGVSGSKSEFYEVAGDVAAEFFDRAGIDRPPARPTGPGSPGRTGPLDFEDLAESLLRRSKRLSYQLVRMMANRTTATFQEVMEEVYSGDREEATVRTLVNRTNNELARLKSRLHFSTKDARVIRHIDPA